jgi:hypothetical protein
MQTSTYQELEHMEREIRSLFSEEEFQQFLDYMSRIDGKVIEIYDSKEETND